MKKKHPLKRRTKRYTNAKLVRRKQLERATATYYASLSGKALEEENRLGAAMAYASSLVNFNEVES